MRQPKSSGESGQTAIIGVLAMLLLVVMLAFSIDIGQDFVEKANVQRAADAAALAGAQALPANPAAAESWARQQAANNGIGDADEVAVQIMSSFVANDTIRVTVTRDVAQRFASLAGIQIVSVSASAASRIASPAGLDRFIPFGIKASAIDPLNHGDPLTIIYNSNDPTQGNSLALAFPGNSGGSDFRNSINDGSSSPFCVTGQGYAGCPEFLQSEPGNMVGPTRQGFDDLIQSTAAICDTFQEVFQPDPNEPSKNRINPACNPFAPYSVSGSKRLAILPVIDQLCSGRCDLPIVRFSLFFVTGVQCNSGSCQVEGLYAENVAGVDGYTPGAYNPGSAFNMVALTE